MLEAVARVVHDGVRPDEAHALFEELARAAEPAQVG
jgi:hypothetical protein